MMTTPSPAARPPTSSRNAAAQPRPHTSTEDVGAMRQALDRASGKPVQARPGDRPAPRLGRAPERLADGRIKREDFPLERETQGEDQVAITPREERRSPTFEDSDRDRQTTSLLLLATAQQPVQPVTVPDAPAPHVDPAAFAQLMTTLWLRERSKGAREVVVTFGSDAWPATGARLVRNAAGSLDVQIHAADGGARFEGEPMDRLAGHMADTGIAIGALSLRDG
ncbi:hypothetical protein HL653_21095 [Sphingomonas sp. AP4-R1]|uniref:hypothetical protein n=1 Tax=Sphingomonas sp. AP4-R1 TaxID=2735134 RepID=UPI001493655B|nr:hypothetical protein [Sphingomonas sp. AP4-R1]QJU59907.1 hypothetical protein HL653_21095 [Sphingomonas sp. AP4-R1]